MDEIEDIRQEKKVRHKLKDILVIVLFATLSNVDDWVEMEYFAHYHQEYLRKYIELKNGIPSHDTLCRVMGMAAPETIQQLYSKWQEAVNRNEGEAIKKIICMDGKTMRSNKRGTGKLSHIVSTWCREDGFGLGQKAVNEKSNEITAIPELLESIQIKDQIVTIDAMGTQTGIAQKIRKKRADYVLALKRNQGTLEYRKYALASGCDVPENANRILDQCAARNLNVIRKWSLSILKSDYPSLKEYFSNLPYDGQEKVIHYLKNGHKDLVSMQIPKDVFTGE